MHTKDMLANALREAGLDAMADKAATGYYHDFLSSLDLPELQLVTELGVAATEHPDKAETITALRQRVNAQTLQLEARLKSAPKGEFVPVLTSA